LVGGFILLQQLFNANANYITANKLRKLVLICRVVNKITLCNGNAQELNVPAFNPAYFFGIRDLGFPWLSSVPKKGKAVPQHTYEDAGGGEEV
jgi:hypothetical protein